MATKRKSPPTETTTAKAKSYDIPWVEKYRPRSLEDVVGNEETLVRLRAIGEDGNMPNLILCGPPGTGKVCLITCCSLNNGLLMCICFGWFE
jgi:replication factor C subunit 2/4